jgi:hypothetical protein
MQVAIVGSRKDADLSMVDTFVRAMYEKDPEIILVSGGAEGVDKYAETLWMQLGGRVLSYRIFQKDPDRWGFEVWKLGSWDVIQTFELSQEPTFANARSALFYRDALVAENCDKCVGFFAPRRTSGTQATLDLAFGAGRDVYEYFARA